MSVFENIDLSKLDPTALSQLPAATPPNGILPNFVDPESRAYIVAIVIYTTLPLMLIFVVLRIYARLRFAYYFGADDVLCFVSAVSVTAFCVILIPNFEVAMGPHQWDVPLSNFTLPVVSRTLASVCLNAVSAMLVKTTLLSLYLRLLSPSRKATTMIWAGVWSCVVFYMSILIVLLATCLPAHKLLPTNPTPFESPQLKIAIAMSIFSVVTDIYVLAIPVNLVFQLPLPLERKVGVLAIFLTGLLASACSVGSAVYRIKQLISPDGVWDSVPTYAFSVGELTGGVICACLPVVFVLFKKEAKFGPWASLMRHIHARRNRTHDSIDDLERDASSEYSATGDKMDPQTAEELPQIPDATMIGHPCLIRREDHTQIPARGGWI